MPDLNLIDDDASAEESLGGEQTTTVQKGGGGGGGGLRLVIILSLTVLIIAGMVYVLNSRGIIHLWGKKQETVVTVPEESFPPEGYSEDQFAEQPVDSMAPGEATDDMALLETTPLEEQAAEPAPAESAPAASGLDEMKGDYTIQVVAFREKEKADDVRSNLEIAGYPSFVEKVPMKGGDWYTVRIGRYPTRQDAKSAVANFAEQIRSNYVIDKIRTK